MLPDTDTLATEFTIVIREWLTPEQCRDIDRRNAEEPEGSPICHSHDFCDANQAMIDTFARFNVELDCQSEEHEKAINAAWARAKVLGFGVPEEAAT